MWTSNHPNFFFVQFVIIILRISSHIQIRNTPLGDNTTPSPSKMATGMKNIPRAAVSTTVSTTGELEAYILYSGPSPSAPKNSLPATHGSFVVFWPRRRIPPTMCAVAYAGRTGSHNLAAAWGIAVTLGLISTNDLPSVRIFTNCTYATKIFDGSNKAGKYKDMWHYMLTDLLTKVKAGRNFHSLHVVHGTPDTSTERDMRHLLQTGMLNPEVTIINSITSCQQFIDEMVCLQSSPPCMKLIPGLKDYSLLQLRQPPYGTPLPNCLSNIHH